MSPILLQQRNLDHHQQKILDPLHKIHLILYCSFLCNHPHHIFLNLQMSRRHRVQLSPDYYQPSAHYFNHLRFHSNMQIEACRLDGFVPSQLVCHLLVIFNYCYFLPEEVAPADYYFMCHRASRLAPNPGSPGIYRKSCRPVISPLVELHHYQTFPTIRESWLAIFVQVYYHACSPCSR
jgi:hypothetical protein